MIKKFDDGSYLELRRAEKSKEEVVLSLCSIDPNNPNMVSVTSVSLSIGDLQGLIDSLE